MRKFAEFNLKLLARWTLNKYKPIIIGITGSVGKTSTKDAVYSVLRNFKRVRAARENFNSELGLLLTILGEWKNYEQRLFGLELKAGENKGKKTLFLLKVFSLSVLRLIFAKKSGYPEILILEYGADRPGDIKNLVNIAKPDIGIITAIGKIPAHVGYYSNIESVAREKRRLIEDLSTSSYAILNADEKLVLDMKSKTRAKIMSFGFDKSASIKISNFGARMDKDTPIGVSFKLEYETSFVPIKIDKCFGRQISYASSAAACVAVIFGINLVRVAESLIFHQSPKHRMRILKGINSSIIIDDSYNASPLSMRAAVDTIKEIKAKRKVAILGDMLELGEYSVAAHEKLGKEVAQTFDFLVTIGAHARLIREAAGRVGLNKKNILSFDSVDESIKTIENLVKKGDLILIKASRGVGLDKIADIIKKT